MLLKRSSLMADRFDSVGKSCIHVLSIVTYRTISWIRTLSNTAKTAHCMATQCYNLITSLVPILYTLALNLRTYYNHDDDDDDDENADNDCCVTFLL